MKLFFCALISCFFVYSAQMSAQNAFQFLSLNANARAAGLSGAFVSMADDPGSVLYNPAAVATLKEQKLSATFLKHVLDINSGIANYNNSQPDFGSYSFAAIFTNYGTFESADALGNKTGSFSGNDIALMASYGNELDSNLYYGFTAKFIFSSLAAANSLAVASDVGLLYQIPKHRTNIGFSLLNIGTQLSTFAGIRESLPLDVRLGVNHRLRGLPLLMNFNFHHLADQTENFFDKLGHFSLGGELYLGKTVQLRVGYDNMVRRAVNSNFQTKTSGFSGGIGIVTSKITIDYAASVLFSSGILHRFSINSSL